MSVNKKKCLIIDDSNFDNKMMSQIASSLGFHVYSVNSASKGLEFCSKDTPDLIFLDWQMPELDGIDFLKILRSSPNGKDILVLMCTSNDTAEAVAQATLAGANSYIVKPFYKKAISQKLKELNFL